MDSISDINGRLSALTARIWLENLTLVNTVILDETCVVHVNHRCFPRLTIAVIGILFAPW
jgi:hypothetical protein